MQLKTISRIQQQYNSAGRTPRLAEEAAAIVGLTASLYRTVRHQVTISGVCCSQQHLLLLCVLNIC